LTQEIRKQKMFGQTAWSTPKKSLSWAKESPARTILEDFGPKMPLEISQDGRSSWPGEPQDRSKLAQQQS
jgi:hypothetical protein